MKQLIISLTGIVAHSASRSFIVVAPDHVNILNFDQEFLETLADDAKVAWDFNDEGFVQTTDHSIEEASPSEQGNFVVIQL